MPRKLFVSSKFTEFDEYVTIGTGGIYFSAEFVKKNNLEDVTFAKFYTFDENPYKFGVEFERGDEKVEGTFAVIRSSRSNSSFYTTARAFMQEVIPLKNLLKTLKGKRSGAANRFELTFDKLEKCFVFTIIPTFEYNCDVLSIPENIYGIYRYLNSNNDVIYIGKGNIKERAKSSERRDWGIARVQYSVLEDKESRSKYESMHIRMYEASNGAKPTYNLISGKQDIE